MDRKRFKCPACCSTKMRFDASAFWDEILQEYIMAEVLSPRDALPICDECGEENTPKEVAIDIEGKEIE